MESTCIFLVLFFGVVAFQCSSARDTITLNTILSSDNGETLVSAGKIFELGFFQAGDGDKNTFVGIWYYNVEPRTVVWVANRDSPLLQVQGFLAISENGNAKLLDSAGVSYFQTDVPASSAISSRTLRLLDSGNLVLYDDDGSGPGNYLWQSFSKPADTFLPGMVMDESLKLVSWMDPTNPAKGNFSFQEDDDNSKLLIIMKRSSIYWRSDHSDSVELPSLITCFLSNCTKNIARKQIPRNGSSVNNQSLDFDYSKSRLLMNSSGEIQFFSLENNAWSLLWSEPLDGCSVFRPCGKFGLCNNTQEREHTCECLSGFSPVSSEDWGRRVFSNGCKRDIPTCSGNSKPDQFLSLKSMNVEKSSRQIIGADNETSCRQACLDDCQSPCEAYYYKATLTRQLLQGNGEDNTRNGEGNCWIWTSDLSNLQESPNNDTGHDVYIRLSDSAAESISRDCEPCGKYIIPYPLSTDLDCGDPSYYSFSCNQSTGQLVFLAMNKTYQVISINSENRTFDVQISNLQGADTDSCSTPSALQLNESLPFDVTNCHAKPSTLSDSRKGYEIAWRPPLEPICNSSLDCKDWPESNCSTKQDATKRCFCNSDFQWDGKALKCISVGPIPFSTTKTTAKPSKAVIIGTTLAGVILLVGSIGCFLYRRRKGGKKNEMILTNLEREDEDLVDEDGNIVDLAYFSLESILEATQNFSDSNKLGQGGFGPVYKGVFPGGQEIAVKRLLSQSGQGMDEFRNEVITIAKLQHRNLVRLLGYCIKGPERLLLYEYMPNTSLDTFIFDQERCVLLDWSMRFDIILGIARGLLYLHQDSRLRIIHRDLKTSNILLDEHMIPKISDFGLARIFAGKEIEANTMRVVGTYGYMSPEYAQAGFYSVKSDVFSFGVIVLEIISGKRNTGFFSSEKALSLLGYAWRLWEEGNAINFVDGRISKGLTDDVTIIKCINIGLLCVQDDPSDRPTMSNALHMLRTEVTTTLPIPKEPGFVPGKFAFSSMSASTSSLQAETHSVNKMSMTLPEGR